VTWNSFPPLVSGSVSDTAGGLSGSTQHLLEVHLQQFQKLKSFAIVDSIATPPRLGRKEHSLIDSCPGGSIAGSIDEMVLHRSVGIAPFFRAYPQQRKKRGCNRATSMGEPHPMAPKALKNVADALSHMFCGWRRELSKNRLAELGSMAHRIHRLLVQVCLERPSLLRVDLLE
jgi:hypothetical protein